MAPPPAWTRQIAVATVRRVRHSPETRRRKAARDAPRHATPPGRLRTPPGRAACLGANVRHSGRRLVDAKVGQGNGCIVQPFPAVAATFPPFGHLAERLPRPNTLDDLGLLLRRHLPPHVRLLATIDTGVISCLHVLLDPCSRHPQQRGRVLLRHLPPLVRFLATIVMRNNSCLYPFCHPLPRYPQQRRRLFLRVRRLPHVLTPIARSCVTTRRPQCRQ